MIGGRFGTEKSFSERKHEWLTRLHVMTLSRLEFSPQRLLKDMKRNCLFLFDGVPVTRTFNCRGILYLEHFTIDEVASSFQL